MSGDGRSDDLSARAPARPFALRTRFLLATLCLLLRPSITAADELPTSAPSVSDAGIELPLDDDDARESEILTDLSAAEIAELEAAEDAAAFDGRPADAPQPTALAAANSAAAASAATSFEASPAEPPEALVDDRDELWFVSSRRARLTADGPTGYDYWRYENRRWRTASLAEFVAADVSIPTCFHVHGNRVSFAEANAGGWTFYTRFTAAGCRERGPLRWVIFSWPSDRCWDVNQRKDVQIKAVRGECYGYYLAWLVDQLPAEARISMIGYSFGTRVIGSSLHILGGGAIRGRALAHRNVEDRAVRTVLLAAALDNNHFSPGHAMQRAPSQIDRLLVAMNCCDPALKWYALLYKITLRPRRGQQSLGYVGVAYAPELVGRVEHRDLTSAVGKVHDARGARYLTPSFVERMRQYVYYEPLGAEK